MADTNADSFIKLGKLIKRKRDTDIQKRVDRIAESALTNEEKIKHIEKLDKIAEQTEKTKIQKRRKQTIDKTKKILNKGIKALEKLTKPAKDLTGKVNKITPSGFFHFFFKERSRIKHFGVGTKTLSPGFLSLKFNFTSDAKNVLTKKVWDAIYCLIKPMKYILREGWKKLNKFEYNLAVYFYAFCEEFYKTDFRRIKPNEFNNYKNIIEIEQLILSCSQDRVHIDYLLNAIEKMVIEHEVFKNKKNEIMDNANMIIRTDVLKPSLSNIFWASTMTVYKKYLKFEEVLKLLSIKPIPRDNFHCTDVIKTKIVAFINDLKTRKEKIERELLLISTLKQTFLKGYENNEINYSILKKVFSMNDKKENQQPEKVVFEDFPKDMVNFMNRLTSNFYYIFDPLFTDSVTIEDDNEQTKVVKVLPQNVLTNVVHYVKLYTERLNRFILRHLNTKIYYEDYTEYLSTGKTPYENEMEFFRLIYESTDSLFELGKTVAYMMQDSNSNKIMDKAQNVIPYKEKIITGIPGFEGKSVQNYLNCLIDFCFKYAHFFSNSKQRILLDSEVRLHNEITGIKETLERIG